MWSSKAQCSTNWFQELGMRESLVYPHTFFVLINQHTHTKQKNSFQTSKEKKQNPPQNPKPKNTQLFLPAAWACYLWVLSCMRRELHQQNKDWKWEEDRRWKKEKKMKKEEEDE